MCWVLLFGAASYFGGGISGTVEAGTACVAGTAGANYGAGGSGAVCNNTATTEAGGAGAKGVVYGRNVICAKNPVTFLDSLLDVVKNGASPEDAEKNYLKTI